jgi:hypothetical protein
MLLLYPGELYRLLGASSFFMKFTYIFSGLYRKGYVYIDVPIADDDCIIGNYV